LKPNAAVNTSRIRQVVRRAGAVFFLTLLCASGPVCAQQATKIAKIGVLESTSPTSFPERLQAFRRGLSELGYVEGQTVVLEYRWAHGKVADLPALAAQLVSLNVDVIVAGTTAAAVAAKEATKSIPIVFAVPADPVGVGLVVSLARPGGNVTGLTSGNVEIMPKRLELLKEVSGGKFSRVAMLFNPADASNVLAVKAAQDTAKPLGLSIRPYPVNAAEEFEAAFTAMAKDRPDGLLVAAGALTDSHAARLAALAAKIRVPAIYGARGFVEAGGLMSYSAGFSDNYRRAAGYVDKLLRGTKPSDLPVESANIFELAINLRAATSLQLNVPKSLLVRADAVLR
jgi:putative tryptophan/tyrosine transport system substrate-binding protein